MAYSSGNCTTVTDFLSALATFATSNGWTQDEWDSTNKELHLHKGSNYFVVKGYDSGSYAWQAYGCTGYASGSAWNAQTGANGLPINQEFQAASTNLFGTGSTYEFFTNTSPDMLYAVAKNTAGGCGHLCVTELTKRGTWTGSGFMVGCGPWVGAPQSTYNGTFAMRAAIKFESYSQAWIGTGNASYPVWAANSLGSNATPHNAWSNHAPFIPIEITANASTNGHRPIGTLTHCRMTNAEAFDPGDTITIGSDTWSVFPRSSRDSSKDAAIAIRKVT